MITHRYVVCVKFLQMMEVENYIFLISFINLFFVGIRLIILIKIYLSEYESY